jgi:hypothetical protein
MQITQFLVGTSLAVLHSFVSYSVPVESVTSTMMPGFELGGVATPLTFQDRLKRLVGGAAAAAAASPSPMVGTTITTQRLMPCITTSGHTFAIWFHFFYLAPLTWLFVKFFIKSYVRRSGTEPAASKQKTFQAGEKKHLPAQVQEHVRSAERRLSNVVQNAEQAGWDAAKGLEREVYGDAGEAVVDDEDVQGLTVPEVGVHGRAKVKGHGRSARRKA